MYFSKAIAPIRDKRIFVQGFAGVNIGQAVVEPPLICGLHHELLPAVTHVDGSGRLQAVTADTHPWLLDVVTEFNKITGVPIILNTSFNINAEPIVRTPDDAISTFFNSGLKNLVQGCYFVDKS